MTVGDVSTSYTLEFDKIFWDFPLENLPKDLKYIKEMEIDCREYMRFSTYLAILSLLFHILRFCVCSRTMRNRIPLKEVL